MCGRGRRGIGCIVDQRKSSSTGFGIHTLALFAGNTSLAFAPVVTLTLATLTFTTVFITVADILHLSITINWAPGPVAIAAVVVALTTIIFTGRRATLTTRRGAAAARRSVAPSWDTTVVTTRAAVATVATTLTAGTITTRVEAP